VAEIMNLGEQLEQREEAYRQTVEAVRELPLPEKNSKIGRIQPDNG